ncbi:type II CRISPR-associated endonuclease Cas1 [Photobacterium sp. ZSDE20]|uniref:CRISPR-associated endonuclease Cas1 n=1 Tax=Photobacterium pectinilyticum TaxID=2906793 RepID=A0ABT1NBB4_9GAMM|nr:type II CRISPR-associated endonuclease Cas1 [Photobacterium sp. ZSDE20]MCQ1061124.1 type II CRISPR-associated endonuclease Cas1 [Photobacterium sp. ZSDE20]MDD1829307.1 type II CRISPR-associated endonuclease Cas1 [Photobacterium sp. ZSDE20]
MSHNQVIIIEQPTYIHLKDSCIIFEQYRQIVARVLPEDIDCLILHYTSTITASALAALAESKATVTFLDKQQLPFAHWHPPNSRHNYKKRLRNLLTLSESPLGARLWQRIVKAKIRSQAETLKLSNIREAKPLATMILKVTPGDSTHIEAQAARIYWSALFGKKFRRHKRDSSEPVNQHLNFGYAIIRSLLAKWLCGRAIALEWGLHHANQENPMCLVDDLMEPFRFVVDRAVAQNLLLCEREISPTSKKAMLADIYKPLQVGQKQFRLATAADATCSSLGRILDRPSKAAASWLTLPYT